MNVTRLDWRGEGRKHNFSITSAWFFVCFMLHHICIVLVINVAYHQKRNELKPNHLGKVWVFFTFIDFSNVIEKCARLEALSNAWLRFLPVRQNGARRHSPSFRPLRDVSGFKAAPPTLPSERAEGGTPEGWWSISSPFSTSFTPSFSFHSPLSPPQPEPAASGSSVDALHSVTRTKWRARVEKRDLYSVAAEWSGRVQSWGGDGGIRRKQAGGCGGKIMGSKVGQIERGWGLLLETKRPRVQDG